MDLPTVLSDSEEFSLISDSQKRELTQSINYFKEIIENIKIWVFESKGYECTGDLLDNTELDLSSYLFSSSNISRYFVHSSCKPHSQKNTKELSFLTNKINTIQVSDLDNTEEWLRHLCGVADQVWAKFVSSKTYTEAWGSLLLMDLIGYKVLEKIVSLRIEKPVYIK